MTKKITKTPALKPEPSTDRKAHIAEATRRVKSRPIRVGITMSALSPGVMDMGAPHNDKQGGAYEVMDVFATRSNDWVTRSIMDLANAAKAKGKDPTSGDIGAALAFVAAVNPQDELEAALAQQMFAAHDISMAMSRSAKQADTWDGIQQYGNLATKMMRTFTAQLEALGKHRRGGEQVVRHIHVDNRGGQAIIADTVHTGGSRNGGILETQPFGPDAGGPALLGQNPAGHPLPVASDARKEAVPNPRRRQPRRTEG